ncbi:hypothetical protein U9M48_036885, partial [Paspalum notatum var. saurae]
ADPAHGSPCEPPLLSSHHPHPLRSRRRAIRGAPQTPHESPPPRPARAPLADSCRPASHTSGPPDTRSTGRAAPYRPATNSAISPVCKILEFTQILEFVDKVLAGMHTIILMQPSKNRGMRTSMDFDSVNHALDGICGLYERKIRNINPMISNLTYGISDLYNFINGLTDISALVNDVSLHTFLPYDRLWIKQKLFQHLKRLAQQ